MTTTHQLCLGNMAANVELAEVKTQIQGDDEMDRQKYILIGAAQSGDDEKVRLSGRV